MRTVFFIVSGLSVVGFLAFLRVWFSNDEKVSPHWLAEKGMYRGIRYNDSEDSSRLDMMRKIARAQERRDRR